MTSTKKLVTDASIGQIITTWAENDGVDPILALCVAWNESGFNPRAQGDWTLTGNEGPFVAPNTPGARPTSFGLYQLHEGGELGTLTMAEAFNPIVNTHTAMQYIAAYNREHPGLTPGELAASAQGPADPTQYAALVNDLYGAVKRGDYPPGWSEAASVKTGLSIMVDEVDPEPAPVLLPKSVSVTLPTLVEGDGMPPSAPVQAVRCLQALLNLGGVALVIDGRFGPDTADGVAQFQSKSGIAITRTVNAETWEKLIP